VDAGTGLTNVAENTTEQAERREGYRVRGATISAMQSDGHAVKINLLRAPDLGGMPLEMVVSSPTASFSLTLTGIKPDAPPEQFFLSPEDFTKYDTETAMLAELLGRENSVNNGGKNRIGNASDPDWKETRRRANEAGQ